MMHIFEILRVLGVLEVEQPTNLYGSKASKVLKELLSSSPPRESAAESFSGQMIDAEHKADKT